MNVQMNDDTHYYFPLTASLKRKANEDPDGTDESRARRGPRHSSPSIAELNGQPTRLF